MEQSLFFQNFRFFLLSYREYHYNDAWHGNNCHYIGYMRSGEGRIVGEDMTLQVKAGELFYIPMGFRYESHWSGSPDVSFDSYGFPYFPNVESHHYLLQKLPMTESIRGFLDALAEDRSVGCRSIGLLYLLLNECLPFMCTSELDSRRRAVEGAIRYMQEVSRLSVPDMARQCKISESGLYAAFRAVKGCTPIDMWHRVQCERAVNLLTTTDLSVEEISTKLNFCSASYFRKVLKAVVGKIPRDIRREGGV